MGKRTGNPIRIVTRIFLPEAAAASFRLEGVAKAALEDSIPVEVLTANAPTGLETEDSRRGYKVRRAPVLRDKDGYVRGYLPYLSFDIPAFFRFLTLPKPCVSLVEPPPTTGVVIRLASWILGRPYVYFAPDLWSQAAQAFASKPVVKVLQALEGWAMRGARAVIAINQDIAGQAKKMGAKRVVTIPNGIDTDLFHTGVGLPEDELKVADQRSKTVGDSPYLVYTGTVSEWQGAQIFIEAYADALRNSSQPERLPQLVFIGQGSQWDLLQETAQELGVSSWIHFLDLVPPQQATIWLREAQAALVSIKPGIGYDFAYPTKILSALASGTPVIYAGKGEAREDIRDHNLGWGLEYRVDAISQVYQLLSSGFKDYAGSVNSPRQLHEWVVENRSLRSSGKQVLQVLKEGMG